MLEDRDCLPSKKGRGAKFSTALKSQEKYCSKAHIQYMIIQYMSFGIVVCINNDGGFKVMSRGYPEDHDLFCICFRIRF